MTHFTVTLDNCADEPIHIPNLIQPNGFLLVVSIADKSIVQISENAATLMKLPAAELLFKPLQSVSPKLYAKLKNNIDATSADGYYDAVKTQINDQNFICVPHMFQQGILILEFEFDQPSGISNNNFIRLLNGAVLSMQQQKTFEQLSHFVAKAVRQLTGYDRVMVYKFDHDYNGDVVAEEKKAGLNSFLNHKFPASDIPEQARTLYLKNWVRVIKDVNYTPVKLTPEINTVTGDFADLSKSFLRSVSPIHLEYLRNMGVKATLTISIVIENRLWGLIACHHYQPKYIGYHQRMGIEFFGKVLSNSWQLLKKNEYDFYKDRALAISNELMAAVRYANSLSETLVTFKDAIIDIAGADGVLIAYDDKYIALGTVPPDTFCRQLMDWLYDNNQYKTYYTDNLSKHFAPAENYTGTASGILSIAFEAANVFRVIWFRGEYINSIDWGGNPAEKNLVMIDDENFRLSPRKSFEKWTEAVKNRSKHWDTYYLKSARIFKSNFIEILAWRNSVYKEQKDKLEIEVSNKTKEVQHLYEELLQQYAKLEAVAFEQSHLARAPVSTMLGLLNLLETEEDINEIRQMHGMLKHEATNLDSVITAIINKVG